MDTVLLGRALARLGAPDKLVHLYAFTIRYLDLLHREYARLRTAMKARAFRLRGDRHSWRSIGWLFGMLMVRSVERAERIMAAMRCRGFDGRLWSLQDDSRFGRADGVFAVAATAGIALLVAVACL
jgi:cobalt/nickel transport system permease protein